MKQHARELVQDNGQSEVNLSLTLSHTPSFALSRHPEPSCRPDAASVAQILSQSDTKLLKWTDNDKDVHARCAILGAELDSAHDLYKDLQEEYFG